MNTVQRERLNHAAKELVTCRKQLNAAEAEWKDVMENFLVEVGGYIYVGDPFPPGWTPGLLFPEHQKSTDQPAAVDTRDTYQVNVGSSIAAELETSRIAEELEKSRKRKVWPRPTR